MSADAYEDCPNCKGEKTVRLDGIWDYDLEASGKINHGLHGRCSACNMEFR